MSSSSKRRGSKGKGKEVANDDGIEMNYTNIKLPKGHKPARDPTNTLCEFPYWIHEGVSTKDMVEDKLLSYIKDEVRDKFMSGLNQDHFVTGREVVWASNNAIIHLTDENIQNWPLLDEANKRDAIHVWPNAGIPDVDFNADAAGGHGGY